ncbi:MAG: hypothetical protein JST79_04325 [Acidobacteria bacterium]|nr:hypothetical protein [Acidobacteriota bacterium]
MQKNTLKERLRSGETVYGTSIGECLDPEISIVLAAAGVEFFFIDTEHSPASYGQIQSMCRTARSAGVVPLVRITQNEGPLITRALDCGAMGIVVPRVDSAEEARAAIQHMKFPPLGRRGFGLRGIVTDFESLPAAERIARANQETMAVIMIESPEGVEAVEEIATVPEIDALFVGPYDLSLSMGIVEQFEHPKFIQAMDRVLQACRKANIAMALQNDNMDLLLRARAMGVRMLMYSSDIGVLLRGYREGLARLRG